MTNEETITSFQHEVLNDPLARDVWDQKYRLRDSDGSSKELTVDDTRARVTQALFEKEPPHVRREARDLIAAGILVPAGRINAGAGSGRRVTLINCYVMRTVPDCLPGIQRAITDAALTMQQGGGVGTDWTTVRPRGAIVGRTCSVSSGVIPFMRQQNAMCQTIMSAGTRRGAMMATLRIDHPDVWNPDHLATARGFDGVEFLTEPSFISAKRQRGELTQFNVSVLVTDAFMRAVAEDGEWDLGHWVPRADGKHVTVLERPIDHDVVEVENDLQERLVTKAGARRPWYVYRRVRARALWDEILRSTYTYAEPGVIFIDRVNNLNNLSYCETIAATNPCFSGDTRVWTTRGARRFEELAASGETVNVLTELADGTLAYRPMISPRKTQTDRPVIRVTFEARRGVRGHHRTLTCVTVTPDHEFFLADGKRARAIELKEGDRIESVYRGRANQKGYIGLRSTSGDHVMEHNLIVELMAGRRPVWPLKHGHHLNGVKTDNSEENVVLKEASAHNSDHMTGDNNPMRAWWNTATPEERACYHENMSVATSGVRNGMYGKKHSSSTLKKIGDKTRDRNADPNYKNKFRAACQAAADRRRVAINHRVVKIEHLTERQDVYCGTVPATGRFFISLDHDHSEGVLVSNCGEQPLPPYGACVLGSVNLAFLVRDPFTDNASIDRNRYKRAIRLGVRLLDNVIDVTSYPLEQQREEARFKRRIGLGVTGFADMLAQLRVRYGSGESIATAEGLARVLCEESYRESNALAAERGPFPLWNADLFNWNTTHADLPEALRAAINVRGLRNGVLNTIAPNGTVSLYVGNVSSGIEPVFSLAAASRKIRQPDGSVREYESVDYAVRLWHRLYPDQTLPSYFVGAMDVSPIEHVKVQAAWQAHIDSSISKTVNCATDLSYEDFKAVYDTAYELGCKGCTTYRYDPVAGRGSVLQEKEPEKPTEETPDVYTTIARGTGVPRESVKKVADALAYSGQPETVRPTPGSVPLYKRDPVMNGRTYKLRWPKTNASWYITVTNDGHRPREVFIVTDDPVHQDWTAAVSRAVTAILRRGGDVAFIAEEFAKVQAPSGGAWLKIGDAEESSYHGSIVGAIGSVLQGEIDRLSGGKVELPGMTADAPAITSDAPPIGEVCASCGAPAVIREEGCRRCLACGHKECG